MNIEGLGDKWIDLLLENKLIRHFSSLYDLDKETVMTLERQGERSAQKLVDSIQKVKIPLSIGLFLLLEFPWWESVRLNS